jgi:hypothetical protein
MGLFRGAGRGLSRGVRLSDKGVYACQAKGCTVFRKGVYGFQKRGVRFSEKGCTVVRQRGVRLSNKTVSRGVGSSAGNFYLKLGVHQRCLRGEQRQRRLLRVHRRQILVILEVVAVPARRVTNKTHLNPGRQGMRRRRRCKRRVRRKETAEVYRTAGEMQGYCTSGTPPRRHTSDHLLKSRE